MTKSFMISQKTLELYYCKRLAGPAVTELHHL